MALQSKGILTLSFDPSRPVTDSIQILETNTNAGFMPGWITQYHEHFYSVSRTEFPTPNSVLGGVFAFQKSGDTNLTLLNYVDSGGQGAVYTDVSRDGRTISVANMSVKCVL
jgi:6-phosphogluconolactonase (cycloisomerase 2 family)